MTTTNLIADISFHGIRELSARARHSAADTHWVDVFSKGTEHELFTLFLRDAATADRLAIAINSAFAPLHYHDHIEESIP